MLVYRCDRCGKYISDDSTGFRLKDYKFNRCDNGSYKIHDLCEDCYDKFLEFLKEPERSEKR